MCLWHSLRVQFSEIWRTKMFYSIVFRWHSESTLGLTSICLSTFGSTLKLSATSVTRLGDYWKFLGTFCRPRVAQIFGDTLLGYFEKANFSVKSTVATFWQFVNMFGPLFIFTSGHSVRMRPNAGQIKKICCVQKMNYRQLSCYHWP